MVTVVSWYTAFTRFKKATARQPSNRYKFHNYSDADTSSDSDAAVEAKTPDKDRQAHTQLSALGRSRLVAICAFTVKHNPYKFQTARDPPRYVC